MLGTGVSHDGSTVLLKDGRVAVAIEKERLTRKKHDGGNDSVSIQYCLAAEGITIDDVALIVQNENFGMFRGGNEWYRGPRAVGERPVVTISHHLAHAYSAFFASPFSESCVLVMDGCGNSLVDVIDTAGAKVPVSPPRTSVTSISRRTATTTLIAKVVTRSTRTSRLGDVAMVAFPFSRQQHWIQLVGYIAR